MKKFFVFLIVMMLGLFGKSQDVNHNYLPFDEKEDTVMVSWGIRFGSVGLTQPVTPPGLSGFQKRAYEEFPERVGVSNFMLDIRTCFARDTATLRSHDGLLGMNLSMLRSRVYLGYQFRMNHGYLGFRAGYEVYRKARGEIDGIRKRFSENVPLVGVECGFTPAWWNESLRVRALYEYDFDHLGWYASGTLTYKVLETKNIRFDGGGQFDGLFGLGFFLGASFADCFVYLSSFEYQFPFQETRFPEQRIGMERGMAFGFSKAFR